MILGLDLSLCNTGVVLIENDKVILELNILSKPSGKRPQDELERLLGITGKIKKVLDENKIDLVVIEGVAMMSSKTTSLVQLAGLNYLTRHMLYRRGIKFLIVPPTVLKKFVTGKGNCAKEVMLLETYKRYRRSYTDNNLCDGFGLAMLGSVLLGQSKGVKFQTEVINKLRIQI